MRRLIGIAIGLIALGALAFAGTASATVLCEEDKDPCPTVYPVGTEIAGELKSGEVTTFSGLGDTCTESSFTGEVTKAGGSSSTVTVALTSLSWGGCNRAKEVVKLGSLELHYQGESGYAGLGTLSGLVYKDSFCTYEVATQSNAGLIPGSPHGQLHMETKAAAWGCPVQTWQVIYTLTAPSPIYVSAS